MDELLKHWEDPRAEQVLSVLSQKGPRTGGELPTPAGIAYSHLIEVRAKKKLQQIVAGRQTEQERTAAIVNFLDAHPDLMKPHPSSAEQAAVEGVLFDVLAKSDDPKAVPLLLKSGKITPTLAKKQMREMLDYANGLTAEEAASNPALIERLYESGDSSVIPLFEKWAPAAKSRGEKSYFESTLRELRKSGNKSNQP